jgi:hypothetical protein
VDAEGSADEDEFEEVKEEVVELEVGGLDSVANKARKSELWKDDDANVDEDNFVEGTSDETL